MEMVKMENLQNKMIEHLKVSLAEQYAFFLKVQNYHWNVTGANFSSIHALFEEIYKDMAVAIDDTAELIRARGQKVAASFSFFNQLKSISDGNEHASCETMIQELGDDLTRLNQLMKEGIALAAKEKDDSAADFLTSRLREQEKRAWMLHSLIA
jgi:starvation-inducible DNA-binding protein